MYRQILVDPNQRDLQRIMWKTSADVPVKTYKLATVTYGTVSAPFLATRTLRALADEEKRNFLTQQIPELLKDLSASSYVFDKEFQDAPVKTLGMLWDPKVDCLTYKVKISDEVNFSKRDVLSEIARLYDPLGLIGPIVTKAKIFIQELWKIKLDWSEQLPPDAMEEWMNFYQKLAKVNNFKISRCILLPATIRIEIHGFSDASERAYAAVVYIKCFNESGQSQTRLLCSKSRVAPLKTLTIPRFINNIKAKESCNKEKYLTADEVKRSTEFLAKIAQLSEFKAEIDALKKGKGVSKTSKLKALYPFLDENSLLRVVGRLCNADLPFEAKHQIIIPSKHKFTKLLFEHMHKKFFHIGAQGLVHQIRMQFWPINGKGIARKTVHDCIAYFRQKPTGVDQLMGNLPSERVTPSAPFLNSGVDFCGPFQIKFKNQRKGIFSKVYVAIFVCLATKAIHLEAMTDLTTEAFIAALKRLCARRGRISTLMSDNATNFKGAAAELNRFIKLICNKNETLANYFASEAIQWKFIPPRSPNFGGLWEAGQRNKWQFEKNNVAVGCLVLLKENDLPPCKWAMARILEVIYGTDGKSPTEDIKAAHPKNHTTTSSTDIKANYPRLRDGCSESKVLNPFKQELWPTFKPTWCGRVGHTSRVCHAKNHKKTFQCCETNERFQEQSSAILTAKVAIPVYSPAKENEKNRRGFPKMSVLTKELISPQKLSEKFLSVMGFQRFSQGILKEKETSQLLSRSVEKYLEDLIEKLRKAAAETAGSDSKIITHHTITYDPGKAIQRTEVSDYVLTTDRFHIADAYRKILLFEMGQANYITVLDLTKGYWQIPMAEEAKPYTAFVTHHGHYQFCVMPFGMKNAGSTFQKVMDQIAIHEVKNKLARGKIEIVAPDGSHGVYFDQWESTSKSKLRNPESRTPNFETRLIGEDDTRAEMHFPKPPHHAKVKILRHGRVIVHPDRNSRFDILHSGSSMASELELVTRQHRPRVRDHGH
ncbi:integrase catalytic domain-containing protein [Trichonephila clavipes]|nr:integrase catalytic domain-containing protein [Trichonephila clavipes]